jgi:glycosyltransferase involved in cell wall biosynthesis
MRIAYVTHIAFPDVVGDPFHSLELARKMSARGHKTAVITWNKRNPSTNSIETVKNVDVWRLAGTNFKLGYHVTEYPCVHGMSSALMQIRPSIIHVQSHLFLTSVQAVRIAKKSGLPSVVTVHGVYAERGTVIDFAQRAYLRTLGLAVLRNADRIICLTRSDSERVEGLGCSEEKIRLIPNAIDTEQFRPCEKRENNLIVWVGRFVREKGLECLIKAAKIVANNAEKARFLLVGYGPLQTKIAKLARDNKLLGSVVCFTGPMNNEEVAELLGKATVFAFPSLKEGLPISILEAMACGTPIVGSAIPGIRDVISNGQDGILVPPESHEQLANAILTLLNDSKLRKRIGQKARQTVTEKYNWNIVLGKIEKVYYELVRETD